MRTPAIILIVLLLVVAAGLHFLFFGDYSRQYRDYSRNLEQNRAEFMRIGQYADDITKIPGMARAVQQKNDEIRSRLVDISHTYQITKPVLETDTPEQEILNLLRSLEELETSTARLAAEQAPAANETRVKVLKNWGIGGQLEAGAEGNRFLRATEGNGRAYAGGPSRISTASGTIDLMVRPYLWNGAEDTEDRTILFAQGTTANPKDSTRPLLSTIELIKTAGGRLEFALTNPTEPALVRSADMRNWKDGEWHRLTATWSKSPQETELYIDGKRSAAFETSPRAVGSRFPSRSRYLSPIEYDFNPEMYGEMMMGGPYSRGGWPMPGTRRTSPLTTSRGGFVQESVPLPESIDKILLGSAENDVAPAGMDIDNLFILRRSVSEAELSSPMQYTEDTLLFDNFQTPYGDVRLLESTLYDMRGCIQIINSPETQQGLREKKEKEYQLLKKSIGLDETRISQQPPKTAYMIQILTTDQIHRLVQQKYTLEELKKILRVPRLAAPGGKEYQAHMMELTSIKGFLDLILQLVQKARNDRLAELTEVVVLGESYVVSDKDLMDQFKKRVEELRDELGVGKTGAGPMGRGYPGMPYMMPGGYPMEMMMMMEGGGEFGMPPWMYGGMGAGMGPGTDYQEYMAKYERYQRFQQALNNGVIPAEVRAELDKAEREAGFYTRRLLQLAVLGTIDYLPQFLYDLEFKDHLASIQAVGMERETEDLINCTVALDIHYVSAKKLEEDQEAPPPAPQ